MKENTSLSTDYFTAYEDLEFTQILNILDVVDVIDTIDLISDMEIDNSLINLRGYNIFRNDETSQEEIKIIPQRPLRDMTNPLEMFTNEEFKERYSLSKETVLYILQLIVNGLERTNLRGKPVPPLIELLITLKFLITGTIQSMIDDLHGISQPTISRLIEKVLFLLAELRHIYIKYPSRAEIKFVSKQFQQFKMPNVIGCLGITHIEIKNPGGDLSESYVNENGYFSFKIQVVCGANMEFLDFPAKWPGATHESKIFEISDLKCSLDAREADGFLLASSSYPPMKHLLTPVENPISSAQIKYNNAFKEAYTVTKAIHAWKRRFKCLTTVLANKEETIKSIIHATAVLHNIALKHNEILDEIEPILCEPKCEYFGQQYSLDKPLEADEFAISAREKYIKKYFTS